MLLKLSHQLTSYKHSFFRKYILILTWIQNGCSHAEEKNVKVCSVLFLGADQVKTLCNFMMSKPMVVILWMIAKFTECLQVIFDVSAVL